jgi:hypothetical protein
MLLPRWGAHPRGQCAGQKSRNRSNSSASDALLSVNDIELNPFRRKADSELKGGKLRENSLS